jgi:hypothetical protein
MRIGSTSPLTRTSQRRDDKGTVADRSFTAAFDNEPAARVSLSSAAALSAVEGLLSLQEVADRSGGRRRAVKRGESLLEALDGLRYALLDGTMPRDRLADLQRLAADTAQLTDDAHLQEIIAEIELRAAVELAKLGEYV